MEAVSEYSNRVIRERLANVAVNPEDGFAWYREKFTTQWLEPMFQPVWSVNGEMQDQPRAKTRLRRFC